MTSPASFDPVKHMCYDGVKPKSTLMMDIGYPVPPGASEVAFTDPFPLFTEEAVRLLRAELLDERVKDPHGPFVRFVPGLSSFQVRGYSGFRDCGVFTKRAWTNEATLKALSQAVGMDIVPVMDYEIGNVNVQLTHGPDTLDLLQPQPSVGSTNSQEHSENTMALPIIDWHKDSYAWTCIVMLSDPTNMRYGDIVIKTNGGILSVPPCPKIGYAMLLQGGQVIVYWINDTMFIVRSYITHLARRGVNVSERVTMVPSFRPKDPRARDDSSLRNSYKISNLNRLHYEWATYRMDLLSERFKIISQSLKEKVAPEQCSWSEPIVNVQQLKEWADEQIAYLKFTMAQMEL